MKRQVLILLVAVVVLLAGGVVQARLAPAVAQGVGGGRADAVPLSGGHYRLVGASAPADVIASGGRYRLLGPVSPSGGNQCCCTYLPCVLRNH